MAAPRPKKKTVVKKKLKVPSRPAKDIKAGDMRSQVLEKGKPQKAKDLRSNDPKSLRNKALREANSNRPRPAKDLKSGGTRAQFLKGPKTPGTSLTVTNRGSLTTPNTRSVVKTGEQVAEKARTAITKTAKNAVGFAEKWIPNALKPKGGGMGLINKAGGVATAVTSIVNPDFMNFKTEKQKEAAKEAGKPSGPLMKGNNMGPTFPKGKGSAAQPKASTGLAEGRSDTGMRIKYSEPIGPKKPKSSGNASGVGGPGGARALTDVKAKKSGPSNTAATAAAAAGSGGGSKSGGSSAAAVKKGRSRPQTRTQRDSLAMEQRKSSSGKPKKSIFSLFRKG